MINQRTYKIRKFANGKARNGSAFINYSLTIPSHIAERLPEDMQFSCELTDSGLLFRPVKPEIEVELPPWAKDEEGQATKQEKKPARKRPKPQSAARKKPTAKRPRRKPQAAPAAPEPKPEPAEPTAESDNGAVEASEPQVAEAATV